MTQYTSKDGQWSANHYANGSLTIFDGLSIVYETNMPYDDMASGKVWALINDLRS